MAGLSNPEPEMWMPRKVPVILVRFYSEAELTRTSRPVAEHVYKPSGMYLYQKDKPVIYHYEYTETRRFPK